MLFFFRTFAAAKALYAPNREATTGKWPFAFAAAKLQLFFEKYKLFREKTSRILGSAFFGPVFGTYEC